MKIQLFGGTGRCRAAMMLLGCGLLMQGAAEACTSVQGGANTSIRIDAWDDIDEGVIVSPWMHDGNAVYLRGCSNSELIPVDVSAAMPDLEFVRNVFVGGETFPAFGIHGKPRAPLLIFQLAIGNGSGGAQLFPFNPLTGLQLSGAGWSGSSRWSWVRMAAVSRGGEMEALPTTIVGEITYSTPSYPALVKKDNYSVTATLKTKTCTLTATAVTLQDVDIADLPTEGSTAREREFNVPMNCNGAFPMFLELTDANAPGNNGSRLTPTGNATAGAVSVQLLLEGDPVVLARRWPVPMSQNGAQDVTLGARYYRETGTLHGGVVEGQAVITATYR
ncbi:fimbrial protein [Stenotrophomonas sp. CC22-02]|uniref:fimbrial protein n=1 Tax=Stenotrophomonas sp. CC22-02 TaxID=1378087 RepID=UPI001063E47E|nr:fimbrial protein [Stenotrophomonas sp. CC22-02]TDV29407.1 fimbrial protein [Stenotrophomonas sp. CC22-02]